MPISETKYIWFNGKFVKWNEAKVHVLTHTLHYGSGVFEGIRCYKTPKGPAIFRLRDHVERLFRSAEVFKIKIPYTLNELSKAIVETVKVNNLDECYIRPIVFRGYGEMGLNPLNSPVEVAIATWTWGAYLGEESLKKGVRVKLSPYIRIPRRAFPSNVKATGAYINSILAKVDALMDGYDEALMFDENGFVVEGPGENFFIVKDEVLYTPPDDSAIILGITRDSIIKIAKNIGYRVEKINIDEQMLYNADEAFFTGTATEVAPICEVDGKKIGNGKPGKVTLRLQQEYLKIVKGENLDYEFWLTYVNY
ncbi:MAG: branched-chain amino acid transaminase [Candidatus Bathyarchaeota archaeon]